MIAVEEWLPAWKKKASAGTRVRKTLGISLISISARNALQRLRLLSSTAAALASGRTGSLAQAIGQQRWQRTERIQSLLAGAPDSAPDDCRGS